MESCAHYRSSRINPDSGRERHLCVEKLAHRVPGAEHVHRDMLSVLRKDAQLSFALRTADSPDAPNQAPFISQTAPAGLITALR